MTTAAPTAVDVAARRARVAQLLREGRSQRAIATALGVSKDVIFRDVQALARGTATTPDQDGPPPAAPRDHTVADDAATVPAPQSATSATPAAPCLMVPLDDALLADLADLTRPGVAPEAAIRHAVALVASTYRQAWDAGLYPRDRCPVVGRHQFVPYQPT
ncbi:helix-turn-helix domain-containing protein [Streptomyces sp. NPDC014861]|uniref:helix-turn-helix domain-containing protein n=1 Tax=Streptomyces sp. NPDC014861 TaxID=3364923 RepID=UPI0036F55352